MPRLVDVAAFTLAVVALSSCGKGESPKLRIAHSSPVAGVRMVEIDVAGLPKPVVMRYRTREPGESVEWASIPSGATGRFVIVVVEELEGNVGVFLRHGATSQKMAFAIPGSKPLKTGTVATKAPSQEDLEAGFCKVIEIKWLRGGDPGKTENIVTSCVVEIGYGQQPTQ